MSSGAFAGVDQVLQGAVGKALTRAAEATGVDFAQLLETARRESSFDAGARAQTSSAAGLFQFIEGTWLTMVARYGATHGLGADAAAIDLSSGRPRVGDAQTRQAILAKRFDPDIAARLAGELTRENAASLEASLGRAPSRGELYAAHVLGAGGAAKLIRASAAGAGDASALFPREAAANRALFFDKAGAARSPAQMLERFERMLTGGGPVTTSATAPRAPVADVGAAIAEVDSLRAAMVAAALHALFDADGSGAASRLMGLGAYGRFSRP